MGKRFLLLICFLFALSIFFAVVAHAAEYYCDQTLSDDGSGSINDPWQWSQAENDTNVSAGDTVYLRGSGGNVTLTTNIDGQRQRQFSGNISAIARPSTRAI
jgi:hypothetical protein